MVSGQSRQERCGPNLATRAAAVSPPTALHSAVACVPQCCQSQGGSKKALSSLSALRNPRRAATPLLLLWSEGLQCHKGEEHRAGFKGLGGTWSVCWPQGPWTVKDDHGSRKRSAAGSRGRKTPEHLCGCPLAQRHFPQLTCPALPTSHFHAQGPGQARNKGGAGEKVVRVAGGHSRLGVGVGAECCTEKGPREQRQTRAWNVPGPRHQAGEGCRREGRAGLSQPSPRTGPSRAGGAGPGGSRPRVHMGMRVGTSKTESRKWRQEPRGGEQVGSGGETGLRHITGGLSEGPRSPLAPALEVGGMSQDREGEQDGQAGGASRPRQLPELTFCFAFYLGSWRGSGDSSIGCWGLNLDLPRVRQVLSPQGPLGRNQGKREQPQGQLPSWGGCGTASGGLAVGLRGTTLHRAGTGARARTLGNQAGEWH